MNTPNKITSARLLLSILILTLLLVPLGKLGINLPKIIVKGYILVDTKYCLAGVLFIIASVTDFLDGYIARKRNLITDLGKVLDAIADKLLVNGVLIILATTGFISPVIPVVVISRDTIVDCIKMVAGQKQGAVAASKLGKIKTTFMMIGVSLTLFYNLPFELFNFRLSDIFLIVATSLSVISGIEYYLKNRAIIVENGI